MTKRLVDIDDELLQNARQASGAATMKETVNVALQHLVDTALRRRHVERFSRGTGTDLADENVMQGAWR